jgi:hypothetical protein
MVNILLPKSSFESELIFFKSFNYAAFGKRAAFFKRGNGDIIF